MGRGEIVKAEDLKRYYGRGKIKTKALDGVSFSIMHGEFLGIMGPSGSGKSTLLHLLGLLDAPTHGRVWFKGKAVSNLSEEAKSRLRLRHIGYVFQQYRLVPELTALENVSLPYMMLTGDFEEAYSKARDVLDRVGLGKRAYHHPYELSGGEQQRVAIARALINSPEIIYADEPTANLDTKTGEKIMNLFQHLNKKYSQTIVVVSHEKEHKKYFDRIIYLKDGKIERMTTSKENTLKMQ